MPKVHRKGRKTRERLIKRYGRWCFIDGHMVPESVKMTLDHIVPLSKGGKNNMSNVQLACSPCNLRKANKMTELLNPDQVKEQHPAIYNTLFAGPPESDRGPEESLHDYLVRKKIPCFCKACRAAAEEKRLANQAQIV